MKIIWTHEFIQQLERFDAELKRLRQHRDNHFGHDPDDINAPIVGDMKPITMALREVNDIVENPG